MLNDNATYRGFLRQHEGVRGYTDLLSHVIDDAIAGELKSKRCTASGRRLLCSALSSWRFSNISANTRSVRIPAKRSPSD
jgi:hypothetical protein